MAENTNVENAYLPDAAPFHNEGKTLASWVAMIGVTLGAIIGAIGFVAPTVWVIVVGAVVVVLSLIAGGVLRSMGHGQPRGPQRSPQRSEETAGVSTKPAARELRA